MASSQITLRSLFLMQEIWTSIEFNNAAFELTGEIQNLTDEDFSNAYDTHLMGRAFT